MSFVFFRRKIITKQENARDRPKISGQLKQFSHLLGASGNKLKRQPREVNVNLTSFYERWFNNSNHTSIQYRYNVRRFDLNLDAMVDEMQSLISTSEKLCWYNVSSTFKQRYFSRWGNCFAFPLQNLQALDTCKYQGDTIHDMIYACCTIFNRYELETIVIPSFSSLTKWTPSWNGGSKAKIPK